MYLARAGDGVLRVVDSSGGEDDDRDEEDGSDLSSQERVRLEQVRSGIFKILSEDPAVETTDDDDGRYNSDREPAEVYIHIYI